MVLGPFVGDVGPEAVASKVARILSLTSMHGSSPTSDGKTTLWRDSKRSTRACAQSAFWTPYEAACWAVIGHRIRMIQAAAAKAKLAQQPGHAIRLVKQRCSPFLPRSDRSISRDFPDSRVASRSVYAGSLELPSMAGLIQKRYGRSRAPRQSTN